MNLTNRQADIVFRIMRELTHELGSKQLRMRVGKMLVDLLDARYLGSYIWDDEKSAFGERVAIDMSDDNLSSYEQYYQYRDPITPVLQRRHRATCVSEILPHRQLVRTEFFNDFLAKDGLHYGINYHARYLGRHVGDLRIWRDCNGQDFGEQEIRILNAIGPAFAMSMWAALKRERGRESRFELLAALDRVAAETSLTNREREVCAEALLGLSDQEISAKYGVSYSTVRTHMNNSFGKLRIRSRSEIAQRVLSG